MKMLRVLAVAATIAGGTSAAQEDTFSLPDDSDVRTMLLLLLDEYDGLIGMMVQELAADPGAADYLALGEALLERAATEHGLAHGYNVVVPDAVMQSGGESFGPVSCHITNKEGVTLFTYECGGLD